MEQAIVKAWKDKLGYSSACFGYFKPRLTEGIFFFVCFSFSLSSGLTKFRWQTFAISEARKKHDTNHQWHKPVFWDQTACVNILGMITCTFSSFLNLQDVNWGLCCHWLEVTRRNAAFHSKWHFITAFIYRMSLQQDWNVTAFTFGQLAASGVLGSLSYPRLTVPSLSPKVVFLHLDLLVHCRHVATTAAVSPAWESPLSHFAALGQGCLSQCVIYKQHIHFLIAQRVIILLLI